MALNCRTAIKLHLNVVQKHAFANFFHPTERTAPGMSCLQFILDNSYLTSDDPQMCISWPELILGSEH